MRSGQSVDSLNDDRIFVDENSCFDRQAVKSKDEEVLDDDDVSVDRKEISLKLLEPVTVGLVI
jgi:hypothetical protein